MHPAERLSNSWRTPGARAAVAAARRRAAGCEAGPGGPQATALAVRGFNRAWHRRCSGAIPFVVLSYAVGTAKKTSDEMPESAVAVDSRAPKWRAHVNRIETARETPRALSQVRRPRPLLARRRPHRDRVRGRCFGEAHKRWGEEHRCAGGLLPTRSALTEFHSATYAYDKSRCARCGRYMPSYELARAALRDESGVRAMYACHAPRKCVQDAWKGLANFGRVLRVGGEINFKQEPAI
jgi:hypothetical protein